MDRLLFLWRNYQENVSLGFMRYCATSEMLFSQQPSKCGKVQIYHLFTSLERNFTTTTTKCCTDKIKKTLKYYKTRKSIKKTKK